MFENGGNGAGTGRQKLHAGLFARGLPSCLSFAASAAAVFDELLFCKRGNARGRGGQRARACVSDHLAAVVCLAARASFDGRVLVWVWRGLVCVQYVILANGARGRAAVALIQQAVANPHLFHFGELVDHDNIAALDGTLPSLSPRVLPRNYDKKHAGESARRSLMLRLACCVLRGALACIFVRNMKRCTAQHRWMWASNRGLSPLL